MKKLFMLPFILLALIFAPLAYAQQNMQANELVVLRSDQTIDGDYFAAGEKVEISGTVNGDVYAAGGQIIIDGTVNGDVLAAGGTISIPGIVSQNVRVAGGDVTISGTVGRNSTVAAGNVEITNAATISGNLVTGAGNVMISAPIAGGIKAGAGSLTIANTVDGTVDAGVGQLRLTSNGRVNGDLNYWSEENGSIDSQASVSGKVTYHQVQDSEISKDTTQNAASGFYFVSSIISFISTVLLGWLLLLLFPNGVRSIINTIQDHPWMSMLVGLVSILVVPVIFILLLITVVGIPLGLILSAIYLIFLYASRIFAIVWIGSFIANKFNRKSSDLWMLVIGAIVYYLLGFLPLIGGLTKMIATFVGFGSTLITLQRSHTKSPSKN